MAGGHEPETGREQIAAADLQETDRKQTAATDEPETGGKRAAGEQEPESGRKQTDAQITDAGKLFEEQGESGSVKQSEDVEETDMEQSAETEGTSETDAFTETEPFMDSMEELPEPGEDPALGLHVTSRSSILLTPGLSEEELTELLGPIREPQPAMPELSKEELEELLAPAARHELTDEGPMPEPEDDEFVSSVMSEITEDDDPEIKALAKQIAELERQEQAEKIKKKSKKGKKRKR